MSTNNAVNLALALTASAAGDVTAKNTPPLDDNTKKLATTEFLLNAFTGTGKRNMTDQGYQVLPGGLIIQWGYATSNASGQALMNNPIAFPNGFLRGVAGYQAGTLTQNIVNLGPCTKTQSNAFICNPAGTAISNAVITFLLIGW